MNESKLLESIARRLGVLIALQLNNQSENFSTTEGVELLTRFGMESTEIAEILNTSSNAVNVMKSRIKSKKK
jgi:DNA-binding CsgD family transcriptional regulator